MMKYWQKKQTRYGVGGITAAALLYGFFRLYKYLRYTPPVRSQIREVSELKKISKEIQNASHVSNASQHIPYGNLVEDPLRFKPKASTLANYRHIKDLSYRIILGLAKGNSYQGIVNISFNLEEIQDFQHKVYLNFNGGGIKYLMINGKVLVAKQIEYKDHEILLPRFLLREGSRNRVEVIFQNYYSFLNEGLCTYFTVDQNQKYSLRQQVIYSINGYKDIQNIIPCFNCLNQCKVQLEVIHSDTFDVFSNTPKSLQRLCSVAQYHQYPFLFQLGAISLSRSYKLNQSTPSSITGQCSGIEQNISMSLSTANYYNRKKANTHFYKQKLPCLNHLFIFCSPMMQLQPTSLNNPLQSELLLRYFCKHDSSHRLMRNVNRIHNYILDLFKKLQSENIKSYINKIDLLIIADADVEGYFAPGVILLSEDSLKEQVVGIKCLYLLARALMGLLQLEKGKKLISLNEILALNELVFNKFEQFRAYLYIKNQKIKKINALLNNPNNFKQITKYEGYFLRYYSKELRYLLKNQNRDKVSLQVVKLVSTINIQNPHQFWTILLSNYSFLPSLIIEPLIKLGLRTIKLPKNVQIVQQLKSCFSNSKYVLSFYSNEEISDNLPRFIEAQTYGLEQRLVNIKVKQKFKDYITQKYQKYLPIRSNINDAENDYHAFKQFNQIKNFHHFTVLKKQMKRITYFGKQFLAGEKINIVCSIMGWKLLKIIRITPADEQLHKMLEAFQVE